MENQIVELPTDLLSWEIAKEASPSVRTAIGSIYTFLKLVRTKYQNSLLLISTGDEVDQIILGCFSRTGKYCNAEVFHTLSNN